MEEEGIQLRLSLGAAARPGLARRPQQADTQHCPASCRELLVLGLGSPSGALGPRCLVTYCMKSHFYHTLRKNGFSHSESTIASSIPCSTLCWLLTLGKSLHVSELPPLIRGMGMVIVTLKVRRDQQRKVPNSDLFQDVGGKNQPGKLT